MPIYEYRCSACGRVSSFLVRNTAAHQPPECPRCHAQRMVRAVSRFAAVGGGKTGRKDAAPPGSADGAAGAPDAGPSSGGPEPDLAEMESMLGGLDENDPRSMGRMMRRMAEQSGERLDPEMDEVVRRLEAGEDPEKIDEKMGDALGDTGADGGGGEDLYDG